MTDHLTHRIPNSKDRLVLYEDANPGEWLKNGKKVPVPKFSVYYLEHTVHPEEGNTNDAFNVCNSEYFDSFSDARACFNKRRESGKPFYTSTRVRT